MNLTSDMEKILRWAERMSTDEIKAQVMTSFDKKADSYYEKRNSQDQISIYEYGFAGFADIKAVLSSLWKEEVMCDMVLISAVSMMKEKPAGISQDEEPGNGNGGNEKNNFEIPEYVYVF